jgi:anti-anti-sigma factor
MASAAPHVVVFRGDLDIATASTVKEELLRRIEQCPGATIDVDLTDVTFIDAVTIGQFISANSRAEEGGASIHLVNVSPFHRRVLRLLGMPATLLDDLEPTFDLGPDLAHGS